MSPLLIDIIGWIATAILAFKAFPQVLKCYRKGNAKGVSPMFLWFWVVGQALMLTFMLLQTTITYPVVVYCAINVIMVSIILRYRYFPRHDNVHDEIELCEEEIELE